MRKFNFDILQARKCDEDVQKICDMCDQLKVSQITKILNLYTPADEYEERVTPAFVRKIQAKLNQRAIAENQSSGTFVGFKKARGGNHEVSAVGESELYFADRVPICIFSSPLNVFCLRTRTKSRSPAVRNHTTYAGGD